MARCSQGVDFEEFASDEKTFDAAAWNLEIIGEAARHISPEMRQRYAFAEWNKIAGLRDVAADEYLGLDEDILWDIVQNRIPRLLEQIRQILATEDG
ncbi:MAG: HepT-like ribonuclease domain-containing protein [Candidatus Roseilinea sp.]|uniref:HepT-like ribonuclease domain-containing protein n=1 Tax=Candidatus Roseilinea sp. TaxID=2838777 RepID=UPI004049C7EF